MRINTGNIIAFIFLLGWTSILIYSGMPQLFEILGGISWFYFAVAFLVCMTLGNKLPQKLLWSIVLTMIGFILVNCCYSYFMFNNRDLTILVRSYLMFTPISIILIGIGATMQYFLPFDGMQTIKKKEDVLTLRHYYVFVMSALLIPTMLAIPIVDLLKGLDNINSISYLIILGLFAIGCLVIVLQTRKVSLETLNYFSKPIPRFDVDAKKVKKWLTSSIVVFVLFSLGMELIYRKQWFIWSETIISFIIYVFILFKFGAILFIPIQSNIDHQININTYLPSIKNKQTIFVIVLLWVLLFIVTFIKA